MFPETPSTIGTDENLLGPGLASVGYVQKSPIRIFRGVQCNMGGM